MKNISLYFKEGSSSKEYHIQLVEKNGKYAINFQYGRIGNALQAGTKTPAPVSFEEADKIYAKLLKEKTSKGYSEGENKNDFTEVTTERKEVYILPQLLNAIEDVEEYINNDSYLAQEKMDGERRMVVADENIKGLNKKGQEVPLSDSIVKSITNICVLDGEIIGSTLFIFDILALEGKSLKELRCEERIHILKSLSFGKGIEIVPTAHTKEEKCKLLNTLKAENKEGIVFKKKDAPYTHGRPASGGNQLKFKFYKTATFIVVNETSGKRSVGLELMSGDDRVFMGKVTIPPNHEVPKEGELVEVRYLYAYKGGAIFQPMYKGKRNDSDLTDATVAQIIYKENT